MATTDIAPSIFDAYNARNHQPHDVAKTFVPSTHYDKLARNSHTLLVGPRGSGKTTLLKMLQQAALEAWQHALAQNYREAINYTGVFIPFDQSWNAQMKSLGRGHLDQKHHQLLSLAAVTTHILKALVSAMYTRKYGSQYAVTPHRRVTLDDSQEARLVTELAKAWYIENIVPSLKALKHALTLRLSRIFEIASQESYCDTAERDDRFVDNPLLHIHFLRATSHAIEVFNDFANDDYGKWALLFDELELAPECVYQELTKSLRSFDDRCLIKLSLSPFTEEVRFLEEVTDPMPGHDFDVIPLWHAHKETGFRFCEDLLAAMLARNKLPPAQAEKIFGDSLFDPLRKNRAAIQSTYKPGSPRQRAFHNLEMKDLSFRKYIKQRGLNLDILHTYTEDERAQDIRKIMPLVVIRDAFRTSDDMNNRSVKRTLRSRKNPNLYSGAKSLFTIVEGNPRWFLGIIAPLIDAYKGDRKVSVNLQSTAIKEAANRFKALLRTIPCPPIAEGSQSHGLLALLDIVGKYFFKTVVSGEFDPDAIGSFKIDSHPSRELLSSLRLAINSGAIVYVPDKREMTLILRSDNLKGKRFRLSYLLAVTYKLPIRLGRSVALSNIQRKAHEPQLFIENGES
jgi:energy-coupling factor transporter ATP-binding protein EcfA2